MFSAAALRTYFGIWLTDYFIPQRLPFSLEANGNKKTLLSYSPTSQAVE